MRADRHAGRRDPAKDRAHGRHAVAERAAILQHCPGPTVPISPDRSVGHRVDPASGCWLWTGAIGGNGYAIAGIPGTSRARVAHRLYYERAKGPIPAGCDLDHVCRRRYCVNPDHLEAVSRSENARRGSGTKLNPVRVRYIRHVFGVFQQSRDLIATVAVGLGVRPGAVLDVIHRRTWRDLP